ncbi:Malonate decarboxylase beta subunit [plant metagenome]|uniref:Malonate decarboxylase beta subunit n=1 Tax=plant metagenome TaxID=1297885 RepID=A0A484SVR0_9ZZZZ
MRGASYYESSARARIAAVLDAGSFTEILPPAERVVSPHLGVLDQPQAFDDGVVVGQGQLHGKPVLVVAQEGDFMGGAVGEVHGAKIVGLLQRAQARQQAGEPQAVVLLLETGGVRLQEANAGLIAVSEIMRAILSARADGVKVVAAIGGQYGCFGGMGIAVSGVDAIVMSEEARLGLSGPEVIETARGVEEFDARDRARVWRTVGGKHRYLLGDCDRLVEDDVLRFREALADLLAEDTPFTLEAVQREHALLADRLARFGKAGDSLEIWAALGWDDPQVVPMTETADFVAQARTRRALPPQEN